MVLWKVIFGGRLGEYKYYDMDQVIAAELERAEELEWKRIFGSYNDYGI